MTPDNKIYRYTLIERNNYLCYSTWLKEISISRQVIKLEVSSLKLKPLFWLRS